MEYHFAEGDFTEHTPVSDLRFDYSVLQDIGEGPGHYLLFVNENAAHVLRKDRFITGDPADFGPWLSEKIKKEIIKLK